jgi:hypothetical protein
MEKCAFPRCSHPVEMDYLGKLLCWRHWILVAEKGKAWAVRKLKIKGQSKEIPHWKLLLEKIKEQGI